MTLKSRLTLIAAAALTATIVAFAMPLPSQLTHGRPPVESSTDARSAQACGCAGHSYSTQFA